MVWSNSFLFLTLRKALPLNGKKKRPDLDAFLFGMQHCFARCSGCFLIYFHLSSRTKRSEVKDLDIIYVDCINECLRDFLDRVFNNSSSLNSEWHLVATKSLFPVYITLNISQKKQNLKSTHLKQRSAFESFGGGPAFSGGAWRKSGEFPWRTKSCLSEASSFCLGNSPDF